MPKDGTTHTKLWFLIYLCALTQRQCVILWQQRRTKTLTS